MTLEAVLEQIKDERVRQDLKWGQQNHPFVPVDLSPDEVVASVDFANVAKELCDESFANGCGTWELILHEEYKEAFAEASLGNMVTFREELIQVAAVVVAMIECLDRNKEAQ